LDVASTDVEVEVEVELTRGVLEEGSSAAPESTCEGGVGLSVLCCFLNFDEDGGFERRMPGRTVVVLLEGEDGDGAKGLE